MDGQQRSATIYDFYSDKLRLSGKGQWSGKRYSDLEEDEQQRFLAYQLSVDLFVAATEADIRQVFRRMNSYTVPLNRQERRHATYQGDFKWFIVEMSELYSQSLKDIGVFRERNLSRMDDARLLTDLCYTVANGIRSQSDPTLDTFYADGEEGYAAASEMRSRLADAFATILRWRVLHNGPLMRSYAFYSLALALMHRTSPVDSFTPIFAFDSRIPLDDDIVLPNLTLLAEVLASAESVPRFSEFIRATEAATNRIGPRTARFQWFCLALQPRLLHETT